MALQIYKVAVHISDYPMLTNRVEDLVRYFEKNGIYCSVAGSITKFARVLNLDKREKFLMILQRGNLVATVTIERW